MVNDSDDEGDEEPLIRFSNLQSPFIPFNNFIKLRVIDDDFTMASFGTPTNPTYGIVASTQPNGYYDSLDGLMDVALREALQDIIANPAIVRAQTYNDCIDILKEADQSPACSVSRHRYRFRQRRKSCAAGCSVAHVRQTSGPDRGANWPRSGAACVPAPGR